MAFLTSVVLLVHIAVMVQDPANKFSIEDTGDFNLPTVDHEVYSWSHFDTKYSWKKLSVTSEADFIKLAEDGNF